MPAAPILHSLHAIDPSTAEGVRKEILDRAVKQVGFLYSNHAFATKVDAVFADYRVD